MKKILLMLALMLPCLGAWAEIQPSTKTDAPENLYKIKTKNGLYMAAHANPTQNNYGRFAFYAVEGKENTYKIYSYDANLWLSYTKAGGYSDGMNFVTFADSKENAYEWCVTKANNGYYQVAPYNNTGVAGRYWNFYGGIDKTYYAHDDYRNTLGLYNKNADGDGGSAWFFETVDDKTAPATINYELKDGNGNVYSGTYTGVAGRTRLFTHQNTLCPITDVTFEGTTYKANITFPFPVSNTETTNKLMINGYNSTSQDFKWYVKEGTYIKVNENSVPTTETINDYLWAIYPTFNEGKLTFTIKNIATEKFITSSTLTAAHDNNTLGLADTGVAFELVNNRGCAFKVTNKTLYLSINSSTDGKGEQPVGLHGGVHDGTSVGFIPYVINYTLTDAANNIFTGEAEGCAALQFAPTFTGAEGYTLSNQVWDANAKTLNATITFPVPVSSATAVNTTLIGQGTWNNADKKWTVVDGNVQVVNGTATLGASQWVIYPSLNGTEFTFKIMSASTGKYVTANPASNADATASSTPITLTENGTGFQFINTGIANTNGFAYKNNGGTTLFITRNGEYDNNALLGVFGANGSHKGNGIRFPEFKEFNVKISDAGYTTVYAPFNALCAHDEYNHGNITENGMVEVYTISMNPKNDRIPLTPMNIDWGGVIRKNSAVILKGKGTYLFKRFDEWDEYIDNEAWDANKLEGSSVNTYIKGDAYVLGVIDNEVGLYKAELNMNEEGVKVGKETGTHFLNNAGKAYLPASAIASTQGVLRFNLGGTTAIESVLNNGADANAPIYDLSGRRVMNTVKGGIYIQNGKKFIVK